MYKLATKNYTSILRIVILAQLQWFIQITTAKKKEFGRVNRNLSSEVQYYYVGLPMSIFGYCMYL